VPKITIHPQFSFPVLVASWSKKPADLKQLKVLSRKGRMIETEQARTHMEKN
jgi:hypothetical protein